MNNNNPKVLNKTFFFSKETDMVGNTLSHCGVLLKFIGWLSPVVILLTCLFSSFTVIKTSEVGIKSKFGILSNSPLKEGVHLKMPFIDNIEKISLKQHQEHFTLNHAQTKDMQPVSVSYKVVYSIPANKVIQNKKELNGDLFEVLIRPRANESIMDALAQYSAEELIINRDRISEKVKLKLSDRINGHAKIDDIAIVEFDFKNKEFKAAVQRKVIAKQDAQTAEIKKQQAQAEADQVLIKAKADAESIRITANAISNNPKIVELRQVEVNAKIAEKWDGKVPNSVVIADGKSNFMLPLK